MNRLSIKVVFICMILSLAGCESTKKVARKYGDFGEYDDYKKALPHDQSIALPKDLKHDAIEDHYAVPKVDDKRVIHSSTLPPGSSIKK